MFGRHVTLNRTVAPTDSLGTVALDLLKSTGIGDSLDGWELLREDGATLAPDLKINAVVRDRWTGNVSVTMRLKVDMPQRSSEPAADATGQTKRKAPLTRKDFRMPDPKDATIPDIKIDKEKPAAKPAAAPAVAKVAPADRNGSDKAGASKPGGYGSAPPAPVAAPPASAPKAEKPAKRGSKPDILIPTDFDIAMAKEAANVAHDASVDVSRKRKKAEKKAEKKADDDDAVVLGEEVADEEDGLTMAGRQASMTQIGLGRAVVEEELEEAERRATVRYYNRMNPHRVYPMLVIISQQMIDRIARQRADQRASGPFKVRFDSPLEVEPIIPGCDCYPPRAHARPGEEDINLTFHVVPSVLGPVPGATVIIRQDHATLAKIELDIRVSQRAWVAALGLLTFALPFASALARHFRLDFTSGEGFNPFLLAAQTLFKQIPPMALLLVLAAVTGVVYWLTRARQKETFGEVSSIGPDQKLAEIAGTMDTDPDRAADDLIYLLQAYPDHVPTRLFFGDWHYGKENFAAALGVYEEAFRRGRGEERHYLQAARAALKIGDRNRALRIQAAANAVLPKHRKSQPEFDAIAAAESHR
jgi:hypothetical protein